MYDVLKIIHVLAAVAWVGGGAIMVVLTARLRDAPPAAQAAVGQQQEFLGNRIYSPLAGLVLISGIWMVLIDESGWSFEQLWIILGFVGIAASMVLGIVLFAPTSRKLAAAAEAGDHATAAALRSRLERASQGLVVLLMIVVAAMVAKWGL